jgi:hypothetical protein
MDSDNDSGVPLPKMDCERCFYKRFDPVEGGHCYMFKDKPEGKYCGRFSQDPRLTQ